MSEGRPRRDQEVDPNAALGAVIGELREEAKLSREDLADRAELEGREIGQIEAGRLEPTWGALRRIASALDVSLPELLARLEDQD